MRSRAGIVLIKDNKIALVERHRAGLDYFVFPGGGVDDGEFPEQAAVREAMEELGIEVAIKQKVAEIHFEQSTQVYFLVEWIGGEFGRGTGEEFTDSNPNNPQEGIYVPIWMAIDALSHHNNVYPVELAKLVLRSVREGWGEEFVVIVEEHK